MTSAIHPDADPANESRACSIADALEILGDRWSLLVVRECGYGVHRFNDIQRDTGAATGILTSRLKRPRAAGIIRREPYSTRPLRHEYFLTAARNFTLSRCATPASQWSNRRTCATPRERLGDHVSSQTSVPARIIAVW
ncbi:winged helix-turn-helix transcriptional regulator [Streptomyces olivaceoviridis]|uniref:winged helix-turn-helix transcriptional regulator n=1 Tax=Streptomyces olivaceoviridis TaxID=1921 RepID=UPI0036CDE755